MYYLITQIFFCLFISFLLGLLVGWMVGRYYSRKIHTSVNTTQPQQTLSQKVVPPPLKKSDSLTETSKPSKKAKRTKASPTQTAHEKLEAIKARNSAAPSVQIKDTPTPKPKASPKPDPTPQPVKETSAPTPATVDLENLGMLEGNGSEIETLEGVGPKTGIALRDIGITTLAEFQRRAVTSNERAAIAKKVGVRPKMVDSWASMSDLLRIEGVDHQAAELMVKSGILCVTDLAAQEISPFIHKMEEVNSAGKRTIAPKVPSHESVKRWITAASKMTPSTKIR